MKKVLPIVVLVMSLLLAASPVMATSPVIAASPIPVNGASGLIDAPPSLEKAPSSSTSSSSSSSPVIAVETTTTMTTPAAFSAGPSSPNYVFMYGANVWSSYSYWNLTNNATIPNGATISSYIEEYWSQSLYITNLHVALFPGNLNGYYVPYSGCNIPEFVGQPVKQNWSTAAYCDKTGNSYPAAYITPVLYLNWTAPASPSSPASSGVTTLSPDGSSKTQIISSN